MVIDLYGEDYLEIRNVAFEWAESYDAKDWNRLQRVLGPSVQLDFRGLGGVLHKDVSPEEYSAVLKGAIGDPCLKTQHLLSGSKWQRQPDHTIQVWHQMRVAHQRYTDESLTQVVNKGHGHGVVQHGYRKIDGVWKLELVVPVLHWSEYDLFGTLNPSEGTELSNRES
jgi:scytalone dehydratase